MRLASKKYGFLCRKCHWLIRRPKLMMLTSPVAYGYYQGNEIRYDRRLGPLWCALSSHRIVVFGGGNYAFPILFRDLAKVIVDDIEVSWKIQSLPQKTCSYHQWWTLPLFFNSEQIDFKSGTVRMDSLIARSVRERNNSAVGLFPDL